MVQLVETINKIFHQTTSNSPTFQCRSICVGNELRVQTLVFTGRATKMLIVSRVVTRDLKSCLTNPHFPKAFDGPRGVAVARPTDSPTVSKLLQASVELDRLYQQIHLHLLTEGSTCGGHTRPTVNPGSLTESVHCVTGLSEGAILTVTSKPTSCHSITT